MKKNYLIINKLLTPFSTNISVFATTKPYQINHKVLFTANEANKFIWSVILAHLSDLKKNINVIMDNINW